MKISEVRTAIAAVLADGLDGVHVYDRLPESIKVPAVAIAGLTVFEQTQDGGRVMSVDVYGVVSMRNTDRLDDLDALMDAEEDNSIPAVINSDPTLDDEVDSTRVVTVGEYRAIEVGSEGYYAATARLEIFC